MLGEQSLSGDNYDKSPLLRDYTVVVFPRKSSNPLEIKLRETKVYRERTHLWK